MKIECRYVQTIKKTITLKYFETDKQYIRLFIIFDDIFLLKILTKGNQTFFISFYTNNNKKNLLN